MKDSLILEHKKYISAKQASVLVGYTSDYVGQLCRESKIESKMVGRTWFVSEESILNHKISNLKKTIDPKFQEILSINKTPDIKNSITEENLVSENKVEEKTNADVIEKKIVELKKVRNVSRALPPVYASQINSGSSLSIGAPSISLVSNNFSKLEDNQFDIAFIIPSKKVLLSLAMVLVIVLNIFVLKNFFISNNSVSNNSNKIISQRSSSDLTASVFSKIADISKSLLSYFGFGNNKLAVENKNLNKENNSVTPGTEQFDSNTKKFDGIAVVPSLGQSEKEEALKKNIKNTFSDEVEVVPDSSGTSGVITPVFKKVSKDNYVYVLVPEVKKKQ
jgi:hypothetical protein